VPIREREPVDALFISYYEDIDRWRNDHAPGAPTGSPAQYDPESSHAEHSFQHRTARQSVGLEGGLVDISRFFSHAAHGTTAEYRRYDAFTTTHLSGAYYDSLAKRHGFDVRHVNHASRVDVYNLARRFAPRYVLLSTTFMVEPAITLDCLQHLRKAFPGVPIVLGGLILVELEKSVSEPDFKRFLASFGADAYVVSAQGEEALLELLAHDGPLTGLDLPSTWVREGRTVRRCGAVERGLAMDDNFVRWDELDPASLYHTVHTRTARSCAFVCSFCSYFSNQGPLVLAQPETLARELEHLARAGHVRSLIFTDDTFNVPATRFKELCRVLERYDVEWYSFFRAQFADQDTARMMADAGCRGVFLGIESLDDRVLKSMRKASTLKAYTRGIRELLTVDINIHANFIIGFPGDVPENTPRFMRWIDDLGVDFFCATPWYCSPATPIHKEKEKYGIVGDYYRWKHDTMDVHQAMELEQSLIAGGEHSIFMTELGGRSFWTEIMLMSNGFTRSELRHAIATYNRFCGADHTKAELEADVGYRTLRTILRSHAMPQAPGSEYYNPPQRFSPSETPARTDAAQDI